VIYDRAGRYPEFIEHFHKLFARSQNALRGRWENLWSGRSPYGVSRKGRDQLDEASWRWWQFLGDHHHKTRRYPLGDRGGGFGRSPYGVSRKGRDQLDEASWR